MNFEEALASLSFFPPKNHETYVQNMDMKFGKRADRFMTAVDQTMAAKIDLNPQSMTHLYKLKNASWEMSLYSSLLEMRI